MGPSTSPSAGTNQVAGVIQCTDTFTDATTAGGVSSRSAAAPEFCVAARAADSHKAEIGDSHSSRPRTQGEYHEQNG